VNGIVGTETRVRIGRDDTLVVDNERYRLCRTNARPGPEAGASVSVFHSVDGQTRFSRDGWELVFTTQPDQVEAPRSPLRSA
jgi:hypothetical protein